jgi:hypothetical protein
LRPLAISDLVERAKAPPQIFAVEHIERGSLYAPALVGKVENILVDLRVGKVWQKMIL